MNQILEEYKEEFEKLDFFNIPKLLKINFFILECEAKHRIPSGDFVTTVEVIKFLNRGLIQIMEALSSEETPNDE